MIAAFLIAFASTLTGVVHDSSGAIVPGAVVIVRPAAGVERQSVTGPDGRFTIDVPEDLHRRIKLQCTARGLKMADEIRALLDKHFPPRSVE